MNPPAPNDVMNVEPLNPQVGAEITGIDITDLDFQLYCHPGSWGLRLSREAPARETARAVLQADRAVTTPGVAIDAREHRCRPRPRSPR